MKNRKHYKEIVAYAEGYDIEVRLSKTEDKWVMIDTPSWDDEREYRIRDPYAEFKEAESRGEVIEFKDLQGYWNIIENPKYEDYPTTMFRVRPKENYRPFSYEDAYLFKDKWVKHKFFKKMFRIASIREDHISSGTGIISYQELLDDYIFANGDYCGVKY